MNEIMFFQPKEFENMTVSYVALPEEPQTYFDPGCPAEVEFHGVYIHGKRAEPALENHLIEHFLDEWEKEILE